jgi:hypothetical protein
MLPTKKAIWFLSTVWNNLIVVFLVGGLIVFFPNPSLSQEEARLTDIIVTNTRDDLLLFLSVKGAFREKMKSAILSGVPTTFSFKMSMHKVQGLWAGEELVKKTVTHFIKYDPLKKEFMVTRSWEPSGLRVTKSFIEARKWMTEINSLRLISLDLLEKGGHYQIRAKAELDKVTLPFYLHYVLFFLSLWDFETDWYTIDFIY